MKVRDLLNVDSDIEIIGITDDSRNVRPGYLFVATNGFHVDHFDYIDKAIENGCVFLVVDREIDFTFPHILVEKIDEVYKELCIKFYGVDLESFHLIGITGTDGKTTTASVVQRLIDHCAYLGTNGLIVEDFTTSTNNTTPCISELYQDLSIVQQQFVSNVVMEVSSEALLHNRVNNFQYDMIAFTNVTGDHLNVHGSFEEYFACKKKLLQYVKKDGIIFVNGDDSNLRTIQDPRMITFGFQDSNDYQIVDYKDTNRGSTFLIQHSSDKVSIVCPLPGKYNAYNITLAFLIASFFEKNKTILVDKIAHLKPISGRCEFLNFGQDYDIVLDYAHTIHGIETILDTFQNYERVIVVTGAAGGRESAKRPIIGKMVIEKSDIAIFTMDDPRYENVDDIIDQMVGEEKDYIRIVNREEAIHYALSIASSGDVVLILGKGRDSYMAIEDKKVSYCDYDVIQNYFKKRI